jgi:hypothetical protein
MKVYAATYEHRHGSDTRVFKTADSAEAWRVSIALEWGRIEDEFFNYDAVPLEE